MINPQDIINTLNSTIKQVSDISDNGGSELDIALTITKAAASLANVSASAAPHVPPSGGSSPPPLDVLAPLRNIMGDLGEGDKYFSKVENFINNAQRVKTEADLINLALQEVVDPNWSFQIDINGDGKSVSLINGSEVINLGRSLLSGNPLDAQTAILGIATKFEKEVFGFSVIETVKELDSLSKALTLPNPTDIKMESVLNMLDGIIGKMGGPRLSPMLKGVLSLVTKLNEKRLEAKKIVEEAVKEFEEKKEALINGTLPTKEETTTTTVAPGEGTPKETPENPGEEEPYLTPPQPKPEEEKPGEDSDERELLESAMEFEDDIGEEDEDYF